MSGYFDENKTRCLFLFLRVFPWIGNTRFSCAAVEPEPHVVHNLWVVECLANM